MKLLIFGKNSYPAKFFSNDLKEKISNIIFFDKRFEIHDILNLDNKSFYIKYFSDIESNFDASINFIHIHKNNFNLEIKINTELCVKLKYAFCEMNIVKNIYLSSVNSYKNSKTSYGITKFKCEEVYRSLSTSIIVRPSTIIDLDLEKKIITGGKKGDSLKNLSSLIKKSFVIPVPGSGRYLQTVCFGTDLAKFLNLLIGINNFDNKTINFFTGEMISYNQFLDINFRLAKIKRIKLFIPIFFISFVILLLNKVLNLKISQKNIENLVNQKIEYNYLEEIDKIFKLKKINISF